MLVPQQEKKIITSLELLEEINKFRALDIKKNDLAHNDLLKVIRSEFDEEIAAGNFSQSYYINSQNKSQPMFELTIFQAQQVLVRESKFVRKAVIKRLDFLENSIDNNQLIEKFNLPKNYSEALEHLLKASKEKEALLIESEQNKPKIKFYETVNETKALLLIREYAKIISSNGFVIGEKKLFRWLREKGFLNNQNEPYQKFIDMGIFDVKEKVIENGNRAFISRTTLITGKGQTYIFEKLKNFFEN